MPPSLETYYFLFVIAAGYFGLTFLKHLRHSEKSNAGKSYSEIALYLSLTYL